MDLYLQTRTPGTYLVCIRCPVGDLWSNRRSRSETGQEVTVVKRASCCVCACTAVKRTGNALIYDRRREVIAER
jgi:hypothetical protein